MTLVVAGSSTSMRAPSDASRHCTADVEVRRGGRACGRAWALTGSTFSTASTMRSTEGRVWSSSASALGRGTWGVVTRVRGPSRCQKHSSATMETISAPHPHSRGFSSTVTSRLVRVTDSSTVAVSSGTSERRSITSAEIPRSSRLVGRLDGLRDHRCQRDDRDVAAGTYGRGHAELVDDLAVRNLALGRVERLLLEEDHRVRSRIGGREQADDVARGWTVPRP